MAAFISQRAAAASFTASLKTRHAEQSSREFFGR
jgi:hypothetical protein